MMPSEKTVLIHGELWKVDDIREDVASCRGRNWKLAQWKSRPALVQKSGGKSSPYIGQQFDPKHWEIVPGGWDHDHCQICWWALTESDDHDRSQGYTSDGEWICLECFRQFIDPDTDEDPV